MHRYGKKERSAEKSTRRRSVAKKRAKKGRWMQSAFATHKKGSLHRFLRVPLDQKIPAAKLRAAEVRLSRAHAAAPKGSRERKKLLSRLREVRLALTARRIGRWRAAGFKKMSLTEARKMSALLDREGRRF